MIPPGYERLLLGHAVAVARSDLALSVRHCLVSADGTRCTLHEYASRHAKARRFQGRGATYAVPLPQSSTHVVVRHNRHGGIFGAMTRDWFLSPTRAPYELQISLELTKLGVRTPEIIAFALYPPGGVLQRSDVASREIPDSRDLAHILMEDEEAERAAALAATADLVAALARAGARHHDLNVKNVLITADTAYVLDVDRMTLGNRPPGALEANLSRLGRSLRQWRDRFAARVSANEITELEAAALRVFQRS